MVLGKREQYFNYTLAAIRDTVFVLITGRKIPS